MHLRCQCQCANVREPTRNFWGRYPASEISRPVKLLFDGTLTLVVVLMAGPRGWQTSCRLGSRQFGLAPKAAKRMSLVSKCGPPVCRHNKRSGPCSFPRFDRQSHPIRKWKNDPRRCWMHWSSFCDRGGPFYVVSSLTLCSSMNTYA